MNQLAAKPATEYSLKILNGPDKGVSFRILSPVVRIGRSPDNDITLAKDTNCSRNHAEIFISSQGPAVRNISKKNLMLVNKKQVKECLVQNGTVIQLGNTKLKFEVHGNAMAKAGAVSGVANAQNQASATSRRPQKKSSLGFYGIIAGIGLLLFIVLSDDDTSKKSNVNEDLLAQKQAEQTQKINQAQRNSTPKSRSMQVNKQAQISYLKGFRDYEHGLYHRAIDSFQACLSLNPSHVLCIKYRNLSERKFNELTQYKMILGRQYKKQHKFSECKKTFENVMYLIRDTTNKTFIEAKSNFNDCQNSLKWRY